MGRPLGRAVGRGRKCGSQTLMRLQADLPRPSDCSRAAPTALLLPPEAASSDAARRRSRCSPCAGMGPLALALGAMALACLPVTLMALPAYCPTPPRWWLPVAHVVLFAMLLICSSHCCLVFWMESLAVAHRIILALLFAGVLMLPGMLHHDEPPASSATNQVSTWVVGTPACSAALQQGTVSTQPALLPCKPGSLVPGIFIAVGAFDCLPHARRRWESQCPAARSQSAAHPVL